MNKKIKNIFIGVYIRKMDSKRRITLPKCFVGKIDNKRICFRVHSKYIEFLPVSRVKKQKTFLTLDKRGRVVVSKKISSHLKIEKHLIVVGVGYNRIEIWNPVAWDNYLNRVESKYECIKAKINKNAYRLKKSNEQN